MAISTKKSVRRGTKKKPSRALPSPGKAQSKIGPKSKSKPDTKKPPGGISSTAVEKATGKGWSEWCRLLDKDGAKKLPHKDIAQLVHDKYAVGDWWSQMVTVGYEQARGLRKPHETARGFQASASKTVNAPLAALYAQWSNPDQRAAWLTSKSLNIRKETPEKSMRISWADDTNVEVNFYAKGPQKSQVALQHNKLKSTKDVTHAKEFWTAALERMKTRLG